MCAIGIGGRYMPTDLDRRRVRGIILAGVAGATDPALRCGEIVVDDCSGPLPGGLPFKVGKISTVQHLVATPTEKQAIFTSSGAVAVEMEGQVVREAARRLGVPYLGIRAICDTAEEWLAPEVLAIIDDLGRPKAGAIAGLLLRQPRLIGPLRRLGAASRLAERNLGQAVRWVVQNWPGRQA